MVSTCPFVEPILSLGVIRAELNLESRADSLFRLICDTWITKYSSLSKPGILIIRMRNPHKDYKDEKPTHKAGDILEGSGIPYIRVLPLQQGSSVRPSLWGCLFLSLLLPLGLQYWISGWLLVGWTWQGSNCPNLDCPSLFHWRPNTG